jgi:hypothetical protein
MEEQEGAHGEQTGEGMQTPEDEVGAVDRSSHSGETVAKPKETLTYWPSWPKKQHETGKHGFPDSSLSTAYRRRKRRHIHVPREPLNWSAVSLRRFLPDSVSAGWCWRLSREARYQLHRPAA